MNVKIRNDYFPLGCKLLRYNFQCSSNCNIHTIASRTAETLALIIFITTAFFAIRHSISLPHSVWAFLSFITQAHTSIVFPCSCIFCQKDVFQTAYLEKGTKPSLPSKYVDPSLVLSWRDLVNLTTSIRSRLVGLIWILNIYIT